MGHWLRVIMDGNEVLNAFFDRAKLGQWGVPNED
jgi:hypothetical protein